MRALKINQHQQFIKKKMQTKIHQDKTLGFICYTSEEGQFYDTQCRWCGQPAERVEKSEEEETIFFVRIDVGRW